MNRLPEITAQPGHRFLEGLVGTQFEVCSIPAAEAAKLAKGLCVLEDSDGYSMRGRYTKNGFKRFDGFGPESEPKRDYIYGNGGAKKPVVPYIFGLPTNVMLLMLPPALPVQEQINQQVVAVPPRKRSIARFMLGDSAVVQPAEVNEESELVDISPSAGSDPFLGILLGRETVWPIATFARRDGGQCDYLQIGREMNDKNFHVTVLDDGSPRLAIVEVIRKILKDQELTEQEMATFQTLVDSEVATHQAKIEVLLEKELARIAKGKIVSSGKQREFTVISNETEQRVGSYHTFGIVEPSKLPDGRTVKYVLAAPDKSEESDGAIDLLAVARGGVAIKIATIDAQAGIYDINVDLLAIDSDKTQKAELVQSIIGLLLSGHGLVGAFNKNRFMEEIKKDFGRFENSNAKDLERAILYSLKTQFDFDWPREMVDTIFSVDEPGIDQDEVTLNVGLYTAQVGSGENPYPNSGTMQKLESIIEQSAKVAGALFNSQKIAELFEQKLGKVRVCDEILFALLGRFCGVGGVSRTLQDVTFGRDFATGKGQTSGDLSVVARVASTGGAYHLKLEGKPAAMDNRPDATLYELFINPDVDLSKIRQENGLSLAVESNVQDLVALLLEINKSTGSGYL